MGQASRTETQDGPRTIGSGYLFGIPLGDLGWFASLLMGVASGFVAFFIGTFLGIVGIVVLNGVTHRGIDLSLSYKLVGLSAGAVVLVLALGYLGMLWSRRKLRRS